MSGVFKRPRTSSIISGIPGDDEGVSADSNSRGDSFSIADNSSRPQSKPTAAAGRRASSTSAAGLSSSYSLPTRSYIHHAGHGSQEPVQYSSSGVREQTAELSSSLVGGSEMPKHFSPEKGTSKAGSGSLRQHEPIQERSEPGSLDGSDDETTEASELTAALRKQCPSNIRQVFRSGGETPSVSTAPSIPDVFVTDEDQNDMTETTPLLPRGRLPSYRKPLIDRHDESDVEEQNYDRPGIWDRFGHHYPSIKTIRRPSFNPKAWNCKQMTQDLIVRPASMLPAVFLGLLLNLLDALSYGIILFPLGEASFANSGADGVSMFYVSCIVAQLTYSTGSIFRGGVGSEMIEVVPFFHKMTYLIIDTMGAENEDALRATVITSYAMSSIVTGIVFFALGSARLGTLVNFFPHSILTGCIGGVGIFLFITGIEVSARLDGNLEFTLDVAKRLFAPETVALWIPPLVLAILLLTIKHFYDRPWLVPAYYIAITAIFYIITTAVPTITMENLRSSGWVFDAPAAGVPFYNFYSYYKWSLIDWRAIWITVPSQLALTFFGILHVPINVPNLAMVVQEDNVSINRELIMHGISNTISGCVGSIQNYLVFVNSVLVINTGGDSRLAGCMLAAATFGLWVAGPVVIGYVPVMVVGTLIYMLGIELAMEALVATYGRLQRLEYITIVIIAVVMGMYDFVVGIAIGIGLACLVYVVQTSRKSVIRAEFSGAVAESTVRRHPRHREYLHKVGQQIRIVKLGGFLFFGSIVDVEKKVRALIDAEAFAARPIRYLVLDFSHVTGIDFSAAEAFGRMNRILHRREVKVVMAGVSLRSEVGQSLEMVGLFVETEEKPCVPVPKVYEDLNGALEACENELLTVFNEKQSSAKSGNSSPPLQIAESTPSFSSSPFDAFIGSPRRTLLHQAATKTLSESSSSDTSKWQHLKQPLPLLLGAFQSFTTRKEDFWFRAVPYFTKRELIAGQMLYARGDKPDGFYLLQSGILRAEYWLEQGQFTESIVAGTTCGELPFFSETERTCSVVAERECVAWLLTPEKWVELQRKEGEAASELLKVGMRLSAERMNAITSYVLITAS